MKTTNKTSKNTTKVVEFTLAKNINERGNVFLMCWYNLKIEGKKIQFRSDKFVPANIERQLHVHHTTPNTIDSLTKKCLNILMPYLPQITVEAKAFLALTKEEQKRQMEEWDNKFQNPALWNY